MTEENYLYRTSPLMLRNQFPGSGRWHIPTIPKAHFADEEFQDLRLIGYDRTKPDDERHLDRMVHFFLYDYKFERVWKRPDQDVEKLKRYRAILSPDFSMYLEMAPVIQLFNVFRNRWCGAYFSSKGIRVIPTVSWGNEDTFEFCFDGIPRGSTVAVSTYMVSAHGNHADQKGFFMKGYREMLRRIEPERIICYNEPFSEMEGNIVFIDYELSSWKYQNEDYTPSKYLAYILGEQPLPANSKIRIKSGYVLRENQLAKGMGSAHGGPWTPKKPEDERFIGEPGEIKPSYAGGKRGGYSRLTKIGDDGRAVMERHGTDHFSPGAHTDPHDHPIDWTGGFPHLGPPINYPDGAPEFKCYRRQKSMDSYIRPNTIEENRFETISDFKWCVNCGGEVQFKWHGKAFGIWPKLRKTPDAPLQMLISQVLIENMETTEKWCDSADEVLEYVIDGDRLRDIITKVEVIDRTI